ncbi:ABC transporter multidrug-family ATP-binding/permease [Clostridioides difficile]|uniref:ABC transporter ATP-binding protein n=1 Tax=Clostridioides difficile TaxID=1496 RepID=UPI00038D9013|nr:ABC transporter ATP-binding protein [Clostridioides difficile]EGT5367090.1 ABC transporter ATP-binding protein [Clostridioides difficile]EII6749465.1 ABC transporter ATP-binding protein [Clostridioides difficile]EII6793338.1 ABC transporter ATP-binding protein [Clostridioides difficile]EQJ68215.1 ABC transporter family protein [Clostridioides difficile P38]MBF9908164.1 ABC transporter ATP-binding protein [Clostridioides difficile]
MFKLIKYLKKSALSIVIIVCLLVIQAVCDLSLPEYTSNIVNVGIQQGGVENSVPSVIRESELNKITLFMDKSSKDKVLDNYTLLNKKDYVKYKDKYPGLKDESLYELNTKDKDTIDDLNVIFGKAILIVSGLEGDSKEVKAMKAQLMSKLPPQATQSGDVDIFKLLSAMPKEQLDTLTKEMSKGFESMPESMITQSSVSYVRSEYEKIGIDTEKTQNNYILFTGAKMLGIAMISMVATITVGFLAARVAASVGRNLRSGVFRKVMSFSNTEMNEFSTASLITRSTNDIQQIQMLMVMLLRIVFYAPIMAIGGVIKVLNTNTSMAWIIAVAVVAILSLIVVLFSVVMPKFKLVQKLVDKLNLVSREIITGIPVIRAFSTEKHEEERFDKANKNLTKTNLFVNRVMTCMMPAMMLIMNLITVLIVWRGAYSVDSGAMQVGDMMAFIQYTMQIIMSFLMISMVSIMLPRASVSATRIDEVLVSDISIKDPEKSEAQEFKEDKKGLVEFKNVSFMYPDAEEPILTNISFTAKPGETTAFIGSTGSGKSTLINLIPRFFDVTEGEILLGGVNIKNVSQHDLREKIGYVPQKGVLFSGTIESNLKYGRKDATDEEMRTAAEIAQATEFIDSKLEAFKTEISQGGTNVSGGQKQRLSIARAIAKNPEVYIFDDSFSALDLKTDAALRKALKSKTAESTVLIVAQRISTILNAEQIIVLNEGEIVGIGTHKELLKNCEVYEQIALSQLSKEELANE